MATCEAYPINGSSCTVLAEMGESVDFVSGSNDRYLVVYVSSEGKTPKLCITIDKDSDDFIEYGDYVIKGSVQSKQSEKYYFLDDLRGVFDCPDTVPGGAVNDSVPLAKSDCSVIYGIYDNLAST